MCKFYFLLLLLSGPVWAAKDNAWSLLRAPIASANPAAEIFGGYNSGCIAGAKAIPAHSAYWELVNVSRGRNYAHPDLYAFLESLGQWSVEQGHLGKLVIGDISQPAGGPLPFGHASHQVGLDVDIRFYFLPKQKSLGQREGEGFREVPIAKHHMVHDKQGVHIESSLIARNWQKAYAEILEKTASHKDVERVFVSPPIKRELCGLYPSNPEWLRKISPYFGHEEHFHVRLACPDSSPACQHQGPVRTDPTDPTKVGCAGQAFNWWFDPSLAKGSYLGDALAEETTPKPTVDKPVPAACQELIAKAQHEETTR